MPSHKGEVRLMTTYEALSLMMQFAVLVIVVLKFRNKK